MNKRTIFVGFLLVMVLAFNSIALAKPVEITVMMFEGGYGSDWVVRSAEAFVKENPNIKINVIASPDIHRQLQPRFLSGNAPDIINPGPNFDILSLIGAGEVAALNQYLDTPSYRGTEKWVDVFTPAQFALQLEGNYYGIPVLFSAGYIWWYDAKLFRDNGWEAPRNWSELYELKEKAGQKGISVFALAGKVPAYTYYGTYLPLVERMGGIQAIEDGFNLVPGAWKSEPYLNAAKELVRMGEEGLFMPKTMGLSHIEAQTQFFQRNALFAMAGTWLEGEMQDVIPADFELTALNQPAWEGGPIEDQLYVPISEGWAGAFYVSESSKNKDAAVAFLKYLTDKESIYRMMERGLASTIVGTEDAIESAALRTALAEMDRAAGKSYIPTGMNPVYPEFNTNVINKFQALLLGQVTPEEFVEYAEQKAEELRKDDSIVKQEFSYR